METVRDLTETDIISVLHKVVTAHLKRTTFTSSPDVDAMQVDSSPARTQDTPSLEEYLGKCVSYDASASGLRLALRKNLGGVEETVAVLQVLESWMRKWGEAEDKLGIFAVPPPASKDGPAQPLPELSKVKASVDNIEAHLMNPFNRWYRSSKRSSTSPFSPSSNTLQRTQSSNPSPAKSNQNSSSRTRSSS